MQVNGIEMGPTVYEAAELRIRENRQKIADLQDEIAAAQIRLKTQRWANVLEAERIASQAEPFQSKQLG